MWKLFDRKKDQVQVLYDIVNLYPSVQVDKAINILVDTLNNDREHLKEHTKLKLTDIHKLTELCLSKCYFLYENILHLFQGSGPIGISLMVVLSECYLQKTEQILEVLNYKIAPETIRCFVDDSHTRFQERSRADHKHSLNF